jgi:WhiB family redox-sensing transcriptional regulator
MGYLPQDSTAAVEHDGYINERAPPTSTATNREKRARAMKVNTSWLDHADCRDTDPDIFFPFGEEGPALDQIDEAKRICRTCPVQAPCLAWALDHQIIDGIWGRTTAEERHAMRKIPRQMKTCRLHGGVDMAVAAAALRHLLGLTIFKGGIAETVWPGTPSAS